MEVPVLVVMALERLDAVGRAVDRRVGDAAHQLGQGAAVVDLRMVGDHVVDLFQVDPLRQASTYSLAKGAQTVSIRATFSSSIR